jgi:hypothetical protein
VLLAVLVAGGGAFAATRLVGGGGNNSAGSSSTAASIAPTTTQASIGTEGSTAQSDAGKTPPSQSSAPSLPGQYAAAGRVFNEYWSGIASGDYNDAYDLYYPGYAVSRSAFAAAENDARPQVALNALGSTPRSHNGDIVTLNARVILRDRLGQYAGECRLLTGWVRFERYGTEWYYRPGAIGGVEPDFAKSPQVLNGDPRCP